MALGQNSLNSKQLGHPFFVKVREGGGGGGKTAPVLDGEDEGHTLSEAGKDLRESFHSCFSLSFASFFFFFLILAKEFTHQVLANSGNKELVKRDSGGYSKRAAGAPPPTPATLVSILVKRGQGCRKPVKKGVCRGCHPVDLSLDSVPPALPSQPRHYLINILRLWSCNNCFFPCCILRALAGSSPYSQHYGWTTAERKQKK